jgi:3-hydroxybutyryl-CoA dehydrogenase
MKLEKVIVIGAGTMGQGIAQWFAQQYMQVELVDVNFDFAQSSLSRIHQSLDKLAFSKKITEVDSNKIKNSISVKKLSEIDRNSDLAIEAIIENMEAKQTLFKELDATLKPEAIIASNTSSLSITKMASSLSETRKKRFVGIHFFNPATIMKLVEVISGVETDEKLTHSLIKWFNEHQKIACLCKDSPGFIVNRVARNFYGESLRAANIFNEEKFREIDHILKEVGGFKMGPFELMDLIGIDVNFSVTESVYHATFNEERFKPHALQRDMVNAHRLGRKTKKGFYSYDS